MKFCCMCGFRMEDSATVCPVCSEKQIVRVQSDRKKQITKAKSSKNDRQKNIGTRKKGKAAVKKKSKTYMIFPVMITCVLIAFLLLRIFGDKSRENVNGTQTVLDEASDLGYISRITEDALSKGRVGTLSRTDEKSDPKEITESEKISEMDESKGLNGVKDIWTKEDDSEGWENKDRIDRLTGSESDMESDPYSYLMDDLKDERRKWKAAEAEWKAEVLEHKAEVEAWEIESENDRLEREQLTKDTWDFEDESEQFEASTEARDSGTVSYEQPTEAEASN